MSSDTDLYPPDLEVVTPEARDARNRAMAGTFLVVMGSGLLLERLISNDLDVLWLAVGLSLIVGWVQAPRFLMFAFGSILTGFAAGGFLESLVSIPFGSTIEKFLAAAGFAAVYVRYPMRAKWALIPAAITAVVGVAEAGVELIGFIPSAITSLMLPLLLIGGGALLLMRHALPSRMVRLGLIVIAVMFVASAASSVDEWDGPGGPDLNFGPPIVFGGPHFTERLDDLDDRTLVVETDSGSITVESTSRDYVVVTALASRVPRPGGGIEIQEHDESVRILFRHDVPTSWHLAVPEGTNLDLSTSSGLVKLAHDGGDVTVSTDAGRVLAELESDDGALSITTSAGQVQVNGDHDLSPSIEATTAAGAIHVDGDVHTRRYSAEGPGTDVEIDTGAGDIHIVGVVDLAA